MAKKAKRSKSSRMSRKRQTVDPEIATKEIVDEFEAGWRAEIIVGRPPFPPADPWKRIKVKNTFYRLIKRSIERNINIITQSDIDTAKTKALRHGGVAKRVAYSEKLPRLDLETIVDTIDYVKVDCPITTRGDITIMGLACDF